jgi:hypothetical protein
MPARRETNRTVPNKTITRHAASYTTNARFVDFLGNAQQVWLPGNDLQDSATWDAPTLCQLKRMHEDLLQHYNCTDQPAAAQPAPPSAQAAALLPTRAQTRSLSPHAFRTTATANSISRSSTTSTRHSTESCFPPGDFQLSGPAAQSAQPYSVATPSHTAAHQAMAPVQGAAPALRWHAL